MNNLRKYGRPPYCVAVIHGGPGTPGEMAPLARQLAPLCGVLEPLQTADSMEGQVEELASVLKKDAAIPATLIGFSWGSLLVLLTATRYPEMVDKLILVSSPPFEEKYATSIMEKRLERLNAEERNEVAYLRGGIENLCAKEKNEKFARLGKLLAVADSFDALTLDDEVLEYQYEVYKKVWPKAAELRRRGLLKMAGKIQCSVVAIHGDYDSHPNEGVREPLSRVVNDFRFILLEKCGHYPWRERLAKDRFFEVLREEVRIGK